MVTAVNINELKTEHDQTSKFYRVRSENDFKVNSEFWQKRALFTPHGFYTAQSSATNYFHPTELYQTQ